MISEKHHINYAFKVKYIKVIFSIRMNDICNVKCIVGYMKKDKVWQNITYIYMASHSTSCTVSKIETNYNIYYCWDERLVIVSQWVKDKALFFVRFSFFVVINSFFIRSRTFLSSAFSRIYQSTEQWMFFRLVFLFERSLFSFPSSWDRFKITERSNLLRIALYQRGLHSVKENTRTLCRH